VRSASRLHSATLVMFGIVLLQTRRDPDAESVEGSPVEC
jgi:hypothetical protein